METCPICKAAVKSTCRCFIGSKTCENNHTYHYYKGELRMGNGHDMHYSRKDRHLFGKSVTATVEPYTLKYNYKGYTCYCVFTVNEKQYLFLGMEMEVPLYSLPSSIEEIVLNYLKGTKYEDEEYIDVMSFQWLLKTVNSKPYNWKGDVPVGFMGDPNDYQGRVNIGKPRDVFKLYATVKEISARVIKKLKPKFILFATDRKAYYKTAKFMAKLGYRLVTENMGNYDAFLYIRIKS